MKGKLEIADIFVRLLIGDVNIKPHGFYDNLKTIEPRFDVLNPAEYNENFHKMGVDFLAVLNKYFITR